MTTTESLFDEIERNKITQVELAQYMGYTRSYISSILIGRRKPPQAKERILGAINEIIAERNN
mgnify:CR=1 FL=1